jgi:hypothetical protein
MGRKRTLAPALNEGPIAGPPEPVPDDQEGRLAAAALMSAMGRKRTLEPSVKTDCYNGGRTCQR